MTAPPQTGWLGRILGSFEDRETRFAAAGVALWLISGIVLFVLFQSASIGTMILIGTLWLLSIAIFARTATQNLFGPVFVYETVRIGRKRLTFILRTLYLFSLTFALTVVFRYWLGSIGYWDNGFQGIRPNQLSQYGDLAFRTFAPIQFGVICLLTPAYVAGCIADEKERKTLEFLFATDLRNREIIFGKLAARVVTLLMYIVAGMPVLSSLMLFGGIDPEMLIGTYAATIITMLGLAALSIYYSTLIRKPRDAIVMTYLTAGAYLIVTAIAPFYLVAFPRMYGPITLLGWEVPVDTIGFWLGGGNPIFAVSQIAYLGTSPDEVGKKYALTYAIIIIVFLGFSIFRLRAIALHQSYGGTAVRGSKKKKEKKALGRPVCGTDPVFWKEVFVDGSSQRGWSMFVANLLLFMLAFIWPVIIFANTHFSSEFIFQGFTNRNNEQFRQGCNWWLRVATGFFGFLMMMGAAVRGGSAVTGEKDRDTWISLISTPLSSWELLIGKWWGAVLSVRRFAWFLIAIWAFNLLVGAVYPFMLIPTAAYLCLYISAFGWVGIFCSCTARNTLIASIRVMMAGLFLAGGFWLVLLFCCFIPLNNTGRGNSDAAEFIATFFLSLTPPFVSGWLPLDSFDRRAMNWFHPDEQHSVGPLGMVFSFFLWIGFTVTVAIASMGAFQKHANRQTSDGLPEPMTRTLPPVKDDPY